MAPRAAGGESRAGAQRHPPRWAGSPATGEGPPPGKTHQCLKLVLFCFYYFLEMGTWSTKEKGAGGFLDWTGKLKIAVPVPPPLG